MESYEKIRWFGKRGRKGSYEYSVAVGEIIKESGAKEFAKEQLVETGKKILGDNSIPNKQKIQKELLKTLIKKELGL